VSVPDFATYIISVCLDIAGQAMRFEGTFEVRADEKKVFDFLTDARKMSSLVPDVENLIISDDGEIRMSVKVGLSFIKGKFNLRMRTLNTRPYAHAELSGQGSGSGSSVDFHALIDIKSSKPEMTEVSWSIDMTIGGLAATMGSRLIQNASDKYIQQLLESFRKAVEG
jgi:carbon monoxide dehydrogenase subunit G